MLQRTRFLCILLFLYNTSVYIFNSSEWQGYRNESRLEDNYCFVEFVKSAEFASITHSCTDDETSPKFYCSDTFLSDDTQKREICYRSSPLAFEEDMTVFIPLIGLKSTLGREEIVHESMGNYGQHRFGAFIYEEKEDSVPLLLEDYSCALYSRHFGFYSSWKNLLNLPQVNECCNAMMPEKSQLYLQQSRELQVPHSCNLTLGCKTNMTRIIEGKQCSFESIQLPLNSFCESDQSQERKICRASALLFEEDKTVFVPMDTPLLGLKSTLGREEIIHKSFSFIGEKITCKNQALIPSQSSNFTVQFHGTDKAKFEDIQHRFAFVSPSAYPMKDGGCFCSASEFDYKVEDLSSSLNVFLYDCTLQSTLGREEMHDFSDTICKANKDDVTTTVQNISTDGRSTTINNEMNQLQELDSAISQNDPPHETCSKSPWNSAAKLILVTQVVLIVLSIYIAG